MEDEVLEGSKLTKDRQRSIRVAFWPLVKAPAVLTDATEYVPRHGIRRLDAWLSLF
jgi:hypothetical protein